MIPDGHGHICLSIIQTFLSIDYPSVYVYIISHTVMFMLLYRILCTRVEVKTLRTLKMPVGLSVLKASELSAGMEAVKVAVYCS